MVFSSVCSLKSIFGVSYIETAASNFLSSPSSPAPAAIADRQFNRIGNASDDVTGGLENTQAISFEGNQYSNKTAHESK
jgi:hypothetical protein